MIVTVTADDIINGRPGDCSECPITLAVARAIPGATRVVVNEYSATWSVGQTTSGADLPYEATSFIKCFDKGTPVEPFQFGLTPLHCLSPLRLKLYKLRRREGEAE